MSDSKKSAKELFEFLLQDMPVKIICLAVAFIIFLFYQRSTLGKRYFSLPLVVENSNELVAASNYPRAVKVTLWGDALNIASIKESDVEVYLDLNAYTSAGNFKVPIKTRINGTALNAEPLDISIEPKTVELRLEESASKRVPVYLTLKGSSAKSYEISQTSVDPSTVEVRGPKSVIEKVESIATEAILLENRNTGFSGKASLVNTNPLVSISGSGKVDYRVGIAVKIINKDLKNISVEIKNLKTGLKITSPAANVLVTLSGAEHILENFTAPAGFVTVDCSEISEPGDYNLKVKLNVPEGLTVKTIFPDTLAIKIGMDDENSASSERSESSE